MDKFGDMLHVLSHALDTKRKRHLLGGVLMSVAMLCAGLAFTVTTLKEETEEDDDKWEI